MVRHVRTREGAPGGRGRCDPMESHDAVSALVDSFYEAALRPELWRQTDRKSVV